MSKLYFCANCAKRIEVYRKALPMHGVVVDLVVPHNCTKNPVKFDLTPQDVPTFEPSEKDNKFVKKLNSLRPPKLPSNETVELRDRRPNDQVKSIAPEALLNNLKRMPNSTPMHNFDGPEDE